MLRAAAAVMLLGLGALAQAPQVRVGVAPYALLPAPTGESTHAVPIEVVVRDGAGQAVAGLQPGNFAVIADGGRIVPTRFVVAGSASSANPPLALALLFDDTHTSAADLRYARGALLPLEQAALGAGGRAALFTVSGAGQLGFTSDTQSLADAIAAVQSRPPAGPRQDCPRIAPLQAYQIVVRQDARALEKAMMANARCGNPYSGALGSAVRVDPAGSAFVRQLAQTEWNLTRSSSVAAQTAISSAISALAQQPGGRVLLLASSGYVAQTLGAGQDAIVSQAIAAHVAVDALEPEGGAGDAAALSALSYLAQATGGRFVRPGGGLEQALRPPPVSYDLSFDAASWHHDGEFHKITVELRPPRLGATVEARSGYFDPELGSSAGQLERALAAAMRSGGQARSVPAAIAVAPGAGTVAVDVHFDMDHMPLISAGGRRRQFLVVIAGLFSPAGAYVAGKRGTLDLALDGAHVKYFRKHGLGATLRLAAPAGSYRLRVAIGEATDGQISAFCRQITVH